MRGEKQGKNGGRIGRGRRIKSRHLKNDGRGLERGRVRVCGGRGEGGLEDEGRREITRREVE